VLLLHVAVEPEAMTFAGLNGGAVVEAGTFFGAQSVDFRLTSVP
jgi:hypothetical protein